MGHELCWVGGERAVALLRSVEGNARQPWPPSPVIQHVVDHTAARGQGLLLGVGMAPSAHFSLALSVQGRTLRWEPAARCNARPQKLGSCYQALVNAWLESPACLCLQAPESQCLIRIQATAPENSRPQFQQTKTGHWHLVPAVPEEFPATVTWTYQASVQS